MLYGTVHTYIPNSPRPSYSTVRYLELSRYLLLIVLVQPAILPHILRPQQYSLQTYLVWLTYHTHNTSTPTLATMQYLHIGKYLANRNSCQVLQSYQSPQVHIYLHVLYTRAGYFAVLCHYWYILYIHTYIHTIRPQQIPKLPYRRYLQYLALLLLFSQVVLAHMQVLTFLLDHTCLVLGTDLTAECKVFVMH